MILLKLFGFWVWMLCREELELVIYRVGFRLMEWRYLWVRIRLLYLLGPWWFHGFHPWLDIFMKLFGHFLIHVSTKRWTYHALCWNLILRTKRRWVIWIFVVKYNCVSLLSVQPAVNNRWNLACAITSCEPAGDNFWIYALLWRFASYFRLQNFSHI